MGRLDEVINKLNKSAGSDIIQKGTSRLTYQKIPFSSPKLNAMTYGGVARGRVIEICGRENGGKAQPLYSKIYTPEGVTTMGELYVGQTIVGGDGKSTTVTGIYPQGVRPIYEITLDDRTSFRVSDEHLNSVFVYNYGTKQNEGYVLTTLELIELLNSSSRSTHSKPRIGIPVLDCWDKRPVPIDPYLLGFLLGDGSLTGGHYKFSNSEPDVIAKVTAKLEDIGCSVVHERRCDFRINENNSNFRNIIRGLDLCCKSVDKFIPEIYMYNDISTRMEVLRGLYDSDGYTSKDDKQYFDTSSEQLSEDFTFLARSLGIGITVTSSKSGYRQDGVYIKCSDSYHHYLKVPNSIKVGTSNKHLSITTQKTHDFPHRQIVSITKVGEDECQCIMVSSPCHTYLTDNLTITHNTSLALDLCGNAQKIFQQEFEDTLREYKVKYDELINGGKSKEKQAAKLLAEMEEFESNGAKVVVYLDLENTLQTDWAELLGVNVDSIILVRPENQTGEQVLQLAMDLIDSGGVGLMVIDSLPLLVPQQIFDESLEKKSMGGIAKLLADFCNKVTPKLTVNDCTLIGLNQVRENVSGYGATEITSGGRAWRHCCSMRLMVCKGDYLDAKCNPVPRNSKNPHGNIINVSIEKTKTCRPDRKVGICTLNYYFGINKIYDLIQLALEYSFIIQSGSWYSIVNPETGEVIQDEEGVPMKYQGISKLIDALNDNPDLVEELDGMLKEKYLED